MSVKDSIRNLDYENKYVSGHPRENGIIMDSRYPNYRTIPC